jgi:hypothetical protein
MILDPNQPADAAEPPQSAGLLSRGLGRAGSYIKSLGSPTKATANEVEKRKKAPSPFDLPDLDVVGGNHLHEVLKAAEAFERTLSKSQGKRPVSRGKNHHH